RNQALPLKERSIRWSQNDRCIDRYGLTNECVGSFRPRPKSVKLPLECGSTTYFAVIDCGELIANLNSSFRARAIRFNATDSENAIFFRTPNSIVRNLKLAFLLEIDDPKDNCGRGEQDQKPGGKPDLKVTLHVSRRQPLGGGCT